MWKAILTAYHKMKEYSHTGCFRGTYFSEGDDLPVHSVSSVTVSSF